jgi:hypothetical protein
MTTGKIFTKWDETELWSHAPIRLEHEMHKSPAFSMDDLARLIENYPANITAWSRPAPAAPAACGAKAISAISPAAK